MIRSTTFKQDPWFEAEDSLKVVLFDSKGVEIETDTFTIFIRKSLESLSQRGQSYKIEARFPKKGSLEKSEYFLKVPDSVPSGHRDSLKTHCINEMKRGAELNELIDRVFESESGEKKEKSSDDKLRSGSLYPIHSFRLPRLIHAGMIRSRTRKGETEEVNLPFVAYEWIDGEPLEHTHVRALSDAEGTGDKSQEDWFGFAVRLAETVRRLHNHGFLHSYIVPRNILVNEETGGFGLVGFGYSSLSIESSAKPQQIMASDRSYRSPEIDAGVALDAIWYASDIFSIGAVLFYALTGHEPKVYDDDGSFKYKNKVNDLKSDVRKALTGISRADYGACGLHSDIYTSLAL